MKPMVGVRTHLAVLTLPRHSKKRPTAKAYMTTLAGLNKAQKILEAVKNMAPLIDRQGESRKHADIAA